MKILLAIDPGKKTGAAMFDISGDEPALLSTREFDQFETERWVEAQLLGYEYPDPDDPYELEVVMERFKIDDLDAPWSLEVIGAVRYLLHKYGLDLTLQTPADAKAFATNERIKKLGFWHVGGAGHANDAIRHGVLYMVRKHVLTGKQLLV